jgi:uncharacterized phiE125 gp8 family phage protein
MALREPVLITAPTVQPIHVYEFKDWERITHDDEDDLLENILEAATTLFERHTGRTLQQSTWEYYLESWPDSSDCPIKLPFASPLISVTEIGYKGTTGAETIWHSSLWVSSTRTMPGRVAPAYGEQYPTETLFPLDPIRIRYTAGIANGSPQTYPAENIRRVIAAIAGSMYELREADVSLKVDQIRVNQLSWVVQQLLSTSATYYFG